MCSNSPAATSAVTTARGSKLTPIPAETQPTMFSAAALIVPIYYGRFLAAGAQTWVALSLLVACLVVLAAMIYGPTAAFLVALYPRSFATRRCRCLTT